MIINYSDQKVIKNKKSIFLAGPTPRNNSAISWITNACKTLKCQHFQYLIMVLNFHLLFYNRS